MGYPALEAQAQAIFHDCRLLPQSVIELRLQKVRQNVNNLISGLTSEERLRIEDCLLSAEFHTWKAHRKPQSPVIELPQDDLVKELNMLPSSLNAQEPQATRLEVHELQQQELSRDVLEMVEAIKKNAEQFSAKLESDNDVLTAATEAITRTAGSMTGVGTRLQKYRKTNAIGWWFYIWSVLFMVLALVGGMLVTQIFPKW